MTDPVEPFGSEKTPHHTLLRLRDFSPNLQDLLIVSSTASSELGLLSRSKTPLTNDKPADSISGVFTTTELLDDTKRPTLPMTDSMDDSVPVGVALDLSSKDKVYRPIPSDEELTESPTPLPGLWVMTHEGILCSWWVVYTDSIREGKPYPGLAIAEGSAPPSASTQATQSAFGQAAASPTPSAFGAASQMGQKSSPWGTPAPSSSGSGAASAGQPTFGSSSFANTQASSAPTFGKPSAFGQSSQLGMRTSPWSTGGTGAPAFGQSGFASFADKSSGSPSSASPFGSTAAPSSGGFASFANKSGFAAAANNSGGSVFGGGSTNNSSPAPAPLSAPSAFGQPSQSTTSAFGQPSQSTTSSFGQPLQSTPSLFGKPSENKASPFGQASQAQSSIFGKPAEAKPNPFASTPAEDNKPTPNAFANDPSVKKAPNPFSATASGGLSSSPFQLKSSFTRDPSAAEDDAKPTEKAGNSMFGSGFASALSDPANKPAVTTPGARDEDMESSTGDTQSTPQANRTLAPATEEQESTTPTTTPAPGKFGLVTSPAPGTSLFGQPTKNEKPTGGFFGKAEPQQDTPKIKVEEDAPLPPDTTSKAAYPLGDSSSSSAASNPTGANTTPAKAEAAPLPPSSQATPKPLANKARAPSTSIFDAPKPTDAGSSGSDRTAQPTGGQSAQDQAKSNAPAPRNPFAHLAPPPEPDTSEEEEEDEDEGDEEGEEQEEEGEEDDEDQGSDEEEEDASEGSGIDVAKDLSPSASGLTGTSPSYTPQSSFGGPGAKAENKLRENDGRAKKLFGEPSFGNNSRAEQNPREENDRARKLFGEVGRAAPIFPRPSETSPRSPSPVRSAVPNRLTRNESYRSVSAPGMASQILGPRSSQSHISRESTAGSEDPYLIHHRRNKARQEAEETQPLVDEEDEQIQKILASEIEPTLALDEFIAHSNVAPPAQESVPSQVEALYKDVNAMIDTLGLNSRTIKAFIKGHSDTSQLIEKNEDALDDPDSWVLCEIDDLGQILQRDLHGSLSECRVNDKEDKLDECQVLLRDVQRLRTKQEDMRKIVQARMDPDQADIAQSLPLSAEQTAQQSELRREFAEFYEQLAQAEKALVLLRTRIAAASGSSGKGNSNVPTVEAVMRTITKMTSMVEKRSGDVDVLEHQLRRMGLDSPRREGSPMTPRRERTVMFSPETTPSRSFRHSLTSSVGPLSRATPPRKKLSGFSKDEKTGLMEKKTRRQAVLAKLKDNVEKRGVNVWNLEDVE